MPDLASLSLWVAIPVFAIAAAVVWAAGTRIAHYADGIAERTGIGRAFLGLLLLGGITSLPEVAVSSTSAYSGDAGMAVNNLLGGLAMQVAILAVADAAIGRDALTSVIVQPIVLLLGILNIILLSVVSVAVVAGDIAVFGIGAWSILIAVLYGVAIRLAATYPGRATWAVTDKRRDDASRSDHAADGRPEIHTKREGPSMQALIVSTCIAGAAIVAAGFVLSRTGEAIAAHTGLGGSFVGAVFLAISTSLPEVSTVLAAVRIRRYEMAMADILGTNLFDVALISVVDAVYAGPPVLNEVGRFSATAALLGIVVTALLLAGLIERRDRTVLRMGYDSLAILAVYIGGVALLYSLR